MPDIRDKIDQKVKVLKKKAQERITLMIIPHGEAHIFNLQLSKITILFAVTVLVAVVFASLLSIQFQENISDEFETLGSVNKAVYNEQIQYLAKYNDLSDKNEELKDFIFTLIRRLKLEGQYSDLFYDSSYIQSQAKAQLQLEGGAFVKLMNQLIERDQQNQLTLSDQDLLKSMRDADIKNGVSYSGEVVAYRELHLDIRQMVCSLKQLTSFVNERFTVHGDLPFYWPLSQGAGNMTSAFGLRISPFRHETTFHSGIDLAVSVGYPILTTGNGHVKHSGYTSGYGHHVVVDHGYGYETLYAHMQRTLVITGQNVVKGQVIGRVGTSGQSTGPHLHYEVRAKESRAGSMKAINPIKFMRAL